jgi:hypothetical protein
MATVLIFVPREREPVAEKKPFVPLTGNPENGDYLDYYNYSADYTRLVEPTEPLLLEHRRHEASVVPIAPFLKKDGSRS